MRFSVKPRDRIFRKGSGILSLVKNIGKNFGKSTGKSISKNLSNKQSQKLLDYVKQAATDVLKTSSKRIIQKIAEATDDLIVNEIAYRIAKVSRSSPHNNSGTIANEHDKEIPEERYISPKGRQKIIDDLKLI